MYCTSKVFVFFYLITQLTAYYFYLKSIELQEASTTTEGVALTMVCEEFKTF